MNRLWKALVVPMGVVACASLISVERAAGQALEPIAQVDEDAESGETVRQQESGEPPSEDQKVKLRRMNGIFGWPPVIFRDTEYGTGPHPGSVVDPSRGYSHYDFHSERHGLWYRPKSFGLKMPQRCAPSPFRPRGYGDFFNRPHTCYRMDYHPYIAENLEGRFGPAYYRRLADPHCPPCTLFGLGGGY